MNQSSPLPSFLLRRRPSPGLASFQALLDLLPFPALLVDGGSERVLLASGGMAELTAFTRDEIHQQSLGSLFPGLERGVLSRMVGLSSAGKTQVGAPAEMEGVEVLAMLARRKGPAVDVYLIPTLLDSQKKWLLLALELSSLRRQRVAEEQRRAETLASYQALVTALQSEDLNFALEQALQAGRDLVGAGVLAIYADAGEDMDLLRSAFLGPDELFPKVIQASELLALSMPAVWVRGKRALHRLHRQARQSGLAYLASTPLGQPGALIGLLLAGGEVAPPGDLLTHLGILASAVTGIVQQEARASSLRQELAGHLDELGRGVAINEAIGEGVVVVAPDLSIIDLNPSAEAILGYASREVRGQPYTNILVGPENLIPPFILEPAELVSATGPHNLSNIRLYRRDGRPFLAQARTLPVVVEQHLTSLVILISDLSQEEQFRLRSQQLEQRALLGEVTAVFAHEVRNPINNISTGLQLMSLNLPTDDPNQEIINRLQGDCDRLADLMKSVLAFARPVEYKMESVDLGASLKRLMERWRPQMARGNVQHTIQIEPHTLPVIGDVRALEQVWNNLISNAIQAMEELGGTLSLKVRPASGPDGSRRMEVSVLDTGPGIPDEVRERVFEPFYTTKRTGTGLGLAITKHIITAHKGTISVTSIPGGTVFQVQLPVSDAGATTEPLASEPDADQR